jgi:hypothetical protein
MIPPGNADDEPRNVLAVDEELLQRAAREQERRWYESRNSRTFHHAAHIDAADSDTRRLLVPRTTEPPHRAKWAVHAAPGIDEIVSPHALRAISRRGWYICDCPLRVELEAGSKAAVLRPHKVREISEAVARFFAEDDFASAMLSAPPPRTRRR